jgi:hypothetical protein
MKIKLTLFVIITAVITLSFTYVATHETKVAQTKTETSNGDTIGGLVSEEN